MMKAMKPAPMPRHPFSPPRDPGGPERSEAELKGGSVGRHFPAAVSCMCESPAGAAERRKRLGEEAEEAGRALPG